MFFKLDLNLLTASSDLKEFIYRYTTTNNNNVSAEMELNNKQKFLL